MNFENFDIDIDANETLEAIENKIIELLTNRFNPHVIDSKDRYMKQIDEHFENIESGKEVICFNINKRKDLIWKYTLSFEYYPENDKKYEKYKDFNLSEMIHEKYDWNCICSRNDIFKDIDDGDPYWGISMKNKKWYLCDLYNSILAGPYTDGKNDFRGEQGIEMSYELCDIGFKFESRIFELKKLESRSKQLE